MKIENVARCQMADDLPMINYCACGHTHKEMDKALKCAKSLLRRMIRERPMYKFEIYTKHI